MDEERIAEATMLDTELLVVFADGCYTVLTGFAIRQFAEEGNRLMGPPAEE